MGIKSFFAAPSKSCLLDIIQECFSLLEGGHIQLSESFAQFDGEPCRMPRTRAMERKSQAMVFFLRPPDNIEVADANNLPSPCCGLN